MAVRGFDGVDDHIAMDGAYPLFPSASVGATMLLLVKPMSTASTDECYSSVGQVAVALNSVMSVYSATTGNTWWGTDVPNADIQPASSVIPTASTWGLLAVTKPSGTSAPRFHYRALGGGSWTRSTASSTSGPATGSNPARWNFGRFTFSGGFRDQRLAMGAIWNRALSDAELDGVYTALSTASVAALTPLSLVEFTQASTATAVTDLMGLSSQGSITGTTVVTGDDPAGWAFGLSSPATAIGQYGWGVYGQGNYGSGFGEDTGTPISASEAHAMSEGATILVVSLAMRNDNWSVTEGTTSLANALDALETHTLTDAPAALLQSVAIGVTDATALAESAALLQTMSIVASDSWALSDASALLTTLALAASDSWALTDLSSLSATLAAVDSATQSEATTGLTASFAVTDAWSLTDVSSVATLLGISVSDATAFADASQVVTQNLLAASDSGALTEGPAALSAAVSASEALSAAELAALLVQTAANDAATQADAAAQISNAMTAADTWTLAELVDVASVNLVVGVDSGALVEAVALSATLAAQETHTQAEALALAIQADAADSATQSEGATTLANALAAVDSTALAELAAVLTVNALTANDSATQSEGTTTIAAALAALDTLAHSDSPAVIAVALDVSEPAVLAEASALANTLGVNDQLVVTDQGVLNQTQFMVASDAFTVTDSALVLTAVPAPDYKLPTTANIAVWAASAVLAERWSKLNVVLTPETTASVAGIVSAVTITEPSYTVNLAQLASTATLVS